MHWSKLWVDFLNGSPDSIQAIFSILGFVVTVIGTIYVVVTFRQQKSINKEQQELNRLSMEKDRRELMPYFRTVKDNDASTDELYIASLYVKDNKALNVQIFHVDGEKKGELLYMPLYVAVPKEEKLLTLSINVDLSKPTSVFHVKFIVTYTDEVGRGYYQSIGYQNKKVVCIYPLPQEKDALRLIHDGDYI